MVRMLERVVRRFIYAFVCSTCLPANLYCKYTYIVIFVCMSMQICCATVCSKNTLPYNSRKLVQIVIGFARVGGKVKRSAGTKLFACILEKVSPLMTLSCGSLCTACRTNKLILNVTAILCVYRAQRFMHRIEGLYVRGQLFTVHRTHSNTLPS